MTTTIYKNAFLILILTLFEIQLNSQENNTIGYSQENRKLDSLDVRISTLVDNKDITGATALMLDKGKLLFDYGMYINATTVFDNAISMINNVKDKDSLLIDTYVDCLNWKGASLCYMSNFDKALECYITIEKYNNNKNDRYSAKAYNGMGIVFAMNQKGALAEEYYRKALLIARRNKDFNLFPIYSNLGAVFMDKNELDSAQIYFIDAHKMALLQKNKDKEIASLQSLAIVNYHLKKYNLSIKYYNEAADMATQEGYYSQLSYLKSNMINSYMALSDYSSAFKVANEALVLALQNKDRLLEANSLKSISKIYEKQGNYKVSLDCLNKSMDIKDSVFNKESEDKLLRQKADFDLYRAQLERTITENSIALELANRRINNMIIVFFISVLVVGLLIVTLVLIKQYKINKTLSSEIKDIRIDDQYRRGELEKEIEIKSRELTSTSLLIVKFNELSYLLNMKLRILKANLSSKSKDMEVVKDMEELISQFAPEKSWEQFKHHFEQVSPEFYDKLDIRYPELTLGEKRICALISLNLSNKEIVSLTGKTAAAIDNAKSRIRKKMNIGSDMNIADIISQFNN